MICKSFTDAVREVLDNPASKVATLCEGYHLWLDGDHPIEATAFVMATPLGVVAKIPDNLWQPEKQSLELPTRIGFLSPDKFLFWDNRPERTVYYWDQVTLPEKPVFFVLYAQFECFAEAYIATPQIGAPLHFHWPSTKSEQLLGLCMEAIAANDPIIGARLRDFRQEYASQTDDWDV